MTRATHWDRKMFPWSNMPRFYPPGRHPAVERWREALRKAEDLKAAYGSTPAPDLDEFIAFMTDKLVAFEESESDAKAREA